MRPAPDERLIAIGAATREVRLSVLTPFHKHDPSPMLARMRNAPAGVEFVLLDDGSNAPALIGNVIAEAEQMNAPVRVIVWAGNRGRAAGRNRLIAEARGAYVLFLDADMAPDTQSFLSIWLGIIATQQPDVAFGGLSLQHASPTTETALHHGLFARSDCRPASMRARAPAQFTASANLLVRRAFLEAHPFDDGFTGWGFEDVDWALTAARHTEILHVDNSAAHVGLDDVATLMRKSAEAGPNFARLAEKHPAHVTRFAAHRVARALKLAPDLPRLRATFARVAESSAPMALRCAAFKLYRASHFAEHMS